MDKITVVCHKDHDRGYEDFQGKCLLCVVDELLLEIGSLMIQKQRAEKREWIELTDEEYDELLLSGDWGGSLIQSTQNKLKEKNT